MRVGLNLSESQGEQPRVRLGGFCANGGARTAVAGRAATVRGDVRVGLAETAVPMIVRAGLAENAVPVKRKV